MLERVQSFLLGFRPKVLIICLDYNLDKKTVLEMDKKQTKKNPHLLEILAIRFYFTKKNEQYKM